MIDILKQFNDRPVVHVNAGENKVVKVYAIAVSEKEVLEIKDHLNRGKRWKGIDTKNMIALGKTDKPTTLILNYLVYKNITDVNTGEAGRSYYYPPMDKCPDREDHVIPFESSHIAWNYYTKILTNRRGMKQSLIISVV